VLAAAHTAVFDAKQNVGVDMIGRNGEVGRMEQDRSLCCGVGFGVALAEEEKVGRGFSGEGFE
jgi:hypothetical protein